MQGKHKPMLLLKAEVQDSTEVLSWLCAGTSLPPSSHPKHQSDLSTGDTSQGRQRCFATHRVICLLFNLWRGSVLQQCPVASTHYNHILWGWQRAEAVTPRAAGSAC